MLQQWNPLDVTSDHAVGYVGQVAVVAWLNLTTLRAIGPCRAALQRARDFGGGPTGLLALITPTAPPPGDAERRAIANLLADPKSGVVASAVVVEGEGFRAAAVRGVITGVQLLARPPFQHKAFGTVDAAVTWLAGHNALKDIDTAVLTEVAVGLLRPGPKR